MSENNIPKAYNKETFAKEFIKLCNTPYWKRKELLWEKYHGEAKM